MAAARPRNEPARNGFQLSNVSWPRDVPSNSSPHGGLPPLTPPDHVPTDDGKQVADSPEAAELGEYDPFQHRDFVNGLGAAGALFHMIKGSLGVGIFTMPMAFRNAGLWTGLFGAFFIGYLCTHCVKLLVMCSHTLSKRTKRPSMGFAETTEAAFLTGPKRLRKYSTAAREFVNISLLISYYFGNTVYVVFIATSLKEVADVYFGVDFNIRLYILSLCVVLVPLGCIRHLRYLVPFSALAIILLMFGCAYVLFFIFSDLPPLDSRPAFSSWSNIPLFYATMCLAIEGIGTVLPVENAMKKPRHFLGCLGVLNIAMVWLVLTYTMVGFLGYLCYGDATKANVILNLDQNTWSQCVKMLVALNVVCSYPLLFCVVIESVWTTYLEPRINESNQTFYHYVTRILLILGTVLLGAALPNLEPIIGLVGTICYSTLGLLFPSLLELITFWHDPVYLRWRRYKNYLLVVAWLVALVAGLWASVNTIIEIYWP